MQKITLAEDEKVLEARVRDYIRKCNNDSCPVFSDFLSDRERAIAFETAKIEGVYETVIAFGGFLDAERTIVGFFPEYSVYMEKDELLKEFPISTLEIQCSGFREHNHRDFLGSILGLGLERFVIGDIIVGDKGYSATVFVHNRIKDFIIDNLKLVGHDGVKVSLCSEEKTGNIKINTLEISGTVASLRLDALISEALNVSRDKAVKLIDGGLVTVNHIQVMEKSYEVREKDIFTVRGSGKYRLSFVGEVNRRGRIRFTAEKYL